jgi:hypothetical protein
MQAQPPHARGRWLNRAHRHASADDGQTMAHERENEKRSGTRCETVSSQNRLRGPSRDADQTCSRPCTEHIGGTEHRSGEHRHETTRERTQLGDRTSAVCPTHSHRLPTWLSELHSKLNAWERENRLSFFSSLESRTPQEPHIMTLPSPCSFIISYRYAGCVNPNGAVIL